MSGILDNDNKPNLRSGIWTALTAFTPSFLGKKMVLGSFLPTFDPTRLTTMTYTSSVAGVNGTWTTNGSAEASPVVGTTYNMYFEVTLPAGAGATQPKITANLVAVAATTSFSDLITQFAAQINALNVSGVNPFPVTAAVTASHLVLTEAPVAPYGAGEALIKVGDIQDPAGNVTIAVFAAGTAHVNPIGNYAALQRIYTSVQPLGFQANIGATQWLAGSSAPISSSSYDVITVQSSPIDKPNNDSGSFWTFQIYVDATTINSASTLAYIKGTINNYAGQAGLAVGDAVPVVPVATTAAGIGIIPSGAVSASVAGNASNFILLPQSFPVGKILTIKGDGTAYKIQVSTGVAYSINAGTAGVGSATIPASLKLTCVLTTPTNWEITGALLTGAYPSSTEANIPSNS